MILGLGFCLPIPRDIRDESALVRFIPNVIFSNWNCVLFHETGYKFRRFAGSYSAKVDLMKNMSTIESAGKGHNKLRVKFLWGLVWSPLFTVYCFHPDFWFHGQFWQKWDLVLAFCGSLWITTIYSFQFILSFGGMFIKFLKSCELWAHFGGTSWNISYFNYSIAIYIWHVNDLHLHKASVNICHIRLHGHV